MPMLRIDRVQSDYLKIELAPDGKTIGQQVDEAIAVNMKIAAPGALRLGAINLEFDEADAHQLYELFYAPKEEPRANGASRPALKERPITNFAKAR